MDSQWKIINPPAGKKIFKISKISEFYKFVWTATRLPSFSHGISKSFASADVSLWEMAFHCYFPARSPVC